MRSKSDPDPTTVERCAVALGAARGKPLAFYLGVQRGIATVNPRSFYLADPRSSVLARGGTRDARATISLAYDLAQPTYDTAQFV